MDMTESIQPRSDQINADDLIAGPMTVTVRDVIVGKAEHPFDFLLVETDRAYRPSKTMRRVIVNAWGSDASTYAGRRMTLYREPSIMFGGQKVGGIRISHMSDISGPLEVMAQTTRGKREKFVVQPIIDSPARAAVASEGQDPGVESGPRHGTTSTTRGGDPTEVEAKQGQDTDAAAGSEGLPPLRSAINAAIRKMQANEQSSFLTTWAQSHGINPSSSAIEERFGEEARDLPALMAKYPTDVKT